MPAFMFNLHVTPNPIRLISLPVLIPKALLLRNGGVHLATLVRLAMGTRLFSYGFAVVVM